MLLGSKAVDVSRDSAGRVTEVLLADGHRVACRRLIVADGARSTLGRVLGRQWHQETVYGVAARAYLRSPRASEPWISSDLELRATDGQVLPGYGWIFPLGNGEVNLGVGALATAKRPADVALRPLINHYPNSSARRGASTVDRVRCPRRCCRWAARCPGWPGRTGCWSATRPPA